MKQPSSKSSLFLMEMIFVVLFFALIAAVYAQVFARAHNTGEQSRNLTEAVMVSRNLAEAFYANGGDEDAMKALFPEADISDDAVILLYDKNWQTMTGTETNDTRYSAQLVFTHDGDFDVAEISVVDGTPSVGQLPEVLYSLSVKRYAPEGRDG